jgi:CRISPR-associated endoribonuclease Cas6
MVIFRAKITQNLPIFDVISRLVQGFIYRKVAPYEHDGFTHSTGKIFKSSTFKFEYRRDSSDFKLLFSSLIPETEEKFAKYVAEHGLELGSIILEEQEVEYRRREWRSNKIIFWANVLMISKTEKGRREFLKPTDEKFLPNLKNHSFQKFETLFQRDYFGGWELEILKSSEKPTKLYYNKKPYFTWGAKYQLQADPEMINMLLSSGIGGQTMKGFGMMQVERENFLERDS